MNRTLTAWPPIAASGQPPAREAELGRYHLRHPPHADTIQLAPIELDASSHFIAAELLFARGNIRGAVFAAQQGMKLGAPRPAQRALYAWLLYQRAGAGAEVHAHVWRHLNAALIADPNCARAHYFKGVLLERIGHTDEAKRHKAIALQLGSLPDP